MKYRHGLQVDVERNTTKNFACANHVLILVFLVRRTAIQHSPCFGKGRAALTFMQWSPLTVPDGLTTLEKVASRSVWASISQESNSSKLL